MVWCVIGVIVFVVWLFFVCLVLCVEGVFKFMIVLFILW